MRQPLAQPHLVQPQRRLLGCFGARLAPYPQRHGHVVERRKLGQQMVKLVNKTQVPVAQLPLLRRGELVQRLAAELHRAAGRGIEPTEQVQQGALAAARCADDGQRLASADLQIDAVQHGEVNRPFAKAFHQPLGGQHHRCLLGVTHSAAPRPG